MLTLVQVRADTGSGNPYTLGDTVSTRAAPPSSKAFPGDSETEGQPVRAPGALGVAEKVLTSRGEKPRVACLCWWSESFSCDSGVSVPFHHVLFSRYWSHGGFRSRLSACPRSTYRISIAMDGLFRLSLLAASNYSKRSSMTRVIH